MAKKQYLDLAGLTTYNDEIKALLAGKAASSHKHAASDINSGTLSSDRLPTVPIAKGGTGATTAAAALTNLGITATATELNYCDGVTSNIQTQLDNTVDLTSAQTVGGTKTFTDSIIIGDATLTYDDTSAALVISFD